VLLAACGLAGPATASAATPVETALTSATQTVGAAAVAVDGQTAAVAPGVGQAAAATVDHATHAPAVQTAVKAVDEPRDRVSSGLGGQGAAVAEGAQRTLDDVAGTVARTAAGCVSPCGPPSAAGTKGGPRPDGGGRGPDGRGPRSEGAIDRDALSRQGGATASGPTRTGARFASWSTAFGVEPALPEAAASSTRADSGDDGEPGGDPLFEPPAIGGSAGPAGLMLLAFAVLVGLLGVALRRLAQPLHMSPGRRGLGAILTPIERPG
jgi:hypothetical protein